MPDGDVSAVRCVPGGWRPVLRGLPGPAGAVPVVWWTRLAGPPVLPCVRAGAGRGSPWADGGRVIVVCRAGGWAGGGAAGGWAGGAADRPGRRTAHGQGAVPLRRTRERTRWVRRRSGRIETSWLSRAPAP